MRTRRPSRKTNFLSLNGFSREHADHFYQSGKELVCCVGVVGFNVIVSFLQIVAGLRRDDDLHYLPGRAPTDLTYHVRKGDALPRIQRIKPGKDAGFFGLSECWELINGLDRIPSGRELLKLLGDASSIPVNHFGSHCVTS